VFHFITYPFVIPFLYGDGFQQVSELEHYLSQGLNISPEF
jgi:hypothetical protein